MFAFSWTGLTDYMQGPVHLIQFSEKPFPPRRFGSRVSVPVISRHHIGSRVQSVSVRVFAEFHRSSMSVLPLRSPIFILFLPAVLFPA